MKRVILTAIAFAAFAATPVCALAGEAADGSLRQQAREYGAFERLTVTMYEPMQLADLVGRSDLIVQASSAGSRTRLDEEENEIYTDYTFELHSLIKNNVPEVRQGSRIVVRRNSGTVEIEGHAVIAQENDFPSFNRDEPYFLFLARSADGSYSVVGGPQGAFTMQDGVRQVATEFGDWTNKRGAVAQSTFVDEVRAFLKFSGK